MDKLNQGFLNMVQSEDDSVRGEISKKASLWIDTEIKEVGLAEKICPSSKPQDNELKALEDRDRVVIVKKIPFEGLSAIRLAELAEPHAEVFPYRRKVQFGFARFATPKYQLTDEVVMAYDLEGLNIKDFLKKKMIPALSRLIDHTWVSMLENSAWAYQSYKDGIGALPAHKFNATAIRAGNRVEYGVLKTIAGLESNGVGFGLTEFSVTDVNKLRNTIEGGNDGPVGELKTFLMTQGDYNDFQTSYVDRLYVMPESVQYIKSGDVVQGQILGKSFEITNETQILRRGNFYAIGDPDKWGVHKIMKETKFYVRDHRDEGEVYTSIWAETKRSLGVYNTLLIKKMESFQGSDQLNVAGASDTGYTIRVPKDIKELIPQTILLDSEVVLPNLGEGPGYNIF